MDRIFWVNQKGVIIIKKPNLKDLFILNKDALIEKIRAEEKEFVDRIRNKDYFKKFLSKLGMTEEGWVENMVDAELKFIEKGTVCVGCEKIFEAKEKEDFCPDCLLGLVETLQKRGFLKEEDSP
ncbi:MAG: hypothetical protein ACOZAL_01545 [Patescibacteria group bacterium]